MLTFDEQKCQAEVRRADTADLLDRVTAFRAGMEPAAVLLIEQELHHRGVTAAAIATLAEQYRRDCLFDTSGTARRCCRCRRPAVVRTRTWHRLFQLLPLYPEQRDFCAEHRPRS